MSLIYRILFFCGILMCMASAAFAQTEVEVPQTEDSLLEDTHVLERRGFSVDLLEKYRNDKNFQYDEMEAKKAKQQAWIFKMLQKVGRFFERIMKPIADKTPIIGKFIRTLPYILAGIAVILLIWSLIKMRPQAKILTDTNVATTHSAFAEVEDMLSYPFEQQIQTHILNKNYKEAVRLMHLLALKHMHQRQLIKWSPTKTNLEYLYELKQAPHRKGFMDITRIFEYVFYGEFVLNDDNFQEAKPLFHQFYKELGAPITL